jgi:hypothetical protein
MLCFALLSSHFQVKPTHTSSLLQGIDGIRWIGAIDGPAIPYKILTDNTGENLRWHRRCHSHQLSITSIPLSLKLIILVQALEITYKARGLGMALWQPSSSTSHCHGRQLNYAGATPRHVCRAMAAMAPTASGTGTPKTVGLWPRS